MRKAFDWFAARPAIWKWAAALVLCAAALAASYQVYVATGQSIVLSVAYAAPAVCVLLFGARQAVASFIVVVAFTAFVMWREGHYLAYAFSLVGAFALYFGAVWVTSQLMARGEELDERTDIMRTVSGGLDCCRHPIVILGPDRSWQFANTAATRAFGMPDDFDPGGRPNDAVVPQMTSHSAAGWRRLSEYCEDADVQLEALDGRLSTYHFTVDKAKDGTVTLSGLEPRANNGSAEKLWQVLRAVTPDPAFAVTADMAVRWMSDSMAEMAGVDADADCGQLDIKDLTNGVTPERFYQEVWKPIRDAKKSTMIPELRPRTPSGGTTAGYTASGTFFHTEEGEYVAITFRRQS